MSPIACGSWRRAGDRATAQRAVGPTAAMSTPGRNSADDYLEAVFRLVSPVGAGPRSDTVIPARVADALEISRTAAGEMLARLTADGLLERDLGRRLRLTAAGTARAEQ